MIPGIVTGLSWLGGIVGGVVPDVVKTVREGFESKREREFLELQHKHHLERIKAEADAKVHAVEIEADVAEMKAARDALVAAIQMPMNQTGIMWLDAVNAMVRPATTVVALMLTVYVMVSVLYFQAHTVPVSEALAMLWFMLEACVGFWFGYRSRNPKHAGQ